MLVLRGFGGGRVVLRREEEGVEMVEKVVKRVVERLDAKRVLTEYQYIIFQNPAVVSVCSCDTVFVACRHRYLYSLWLGT